MVYLAHAVNLELLIFPIFSCLLDIKEKQKFGIAFPESQLKAAIEDCGQRQ